MLHILLLILKIIGIIFAVILGILVLLVCVVLFVPVRYDIEASCDGTWAGVHARVKVTWLLHLLGLYGCYEDKELSWKIRVAWKNIKNGQEDNKKIKEEVQTYDEEMEELWESLEESMEEETKESPETERDLEEETKESPETKGDLEEESEKSLESERILEKARKEADKSEEDKPCKDLENQRRQTAEDREEVQDHAEEAGGRLEETETGISEELEETEAGISEELEETEAGIGKRLEEDERGSEEERKHVWRKITEICRKIVQKVREIYQKITEIPGKIKGMIQRIFDKVDVLLEKKNKIAEFLTDEVHRKAFVKVKDEGLLLLHKLKPKRFLADIHYGFEDPCLTGKVLAGFSIIYPFVEENVRVSPDFEQKILEGRMKIVGRIRVSYFVRLLWDLVWCREVRMTYRHVRSFKL